MNSIDRRAADLGEVVRDILKQFNSVNAAAANGPHVELNMQELRVIQHLGMEGTRKMRELAEYAMVAVSSMTWTVDQLEKRGLVRRLRIDKDRRVIRVELTETGHGMYQAIADINMRLFRTMLGALTEDEQELFMMLFRKIARAGRLQAEEIVSSA
jgi:MarR family transcriptional regulator, 2-MHQ and catechol-resistance regulon repressor